MTQVLLQGAVFVAVLCIATAHHKARRRIGDHTILDTLKDFSIHIVLYSGYVIPFPH